MRTIGSVWATCVGRRCRGPWRARGSARRTWRPASAAAVLTLNFMDAPVYRALRHLRRRDVPAGQRAHRPAAGAAAAGPRSTGGATPEPGDRMREGELAVIPFIQAQMDIGFRPVSIGRWLRVAGDSLRRMAETESDAWRTDLMEPVLAREGARKTWVRPPPPRSRCGWTRRPTRPWWRCGTRGRCTPGRTTSSAGSSRR